MISANDFKNGVVIKYKDSLYQILEFHHQKMQQRAPIVRTKMINMKTGQTIEEPFRSGDKFEDVFLERKEIQYLYEDGNLLHFMNNDDFQDVVISKEMMKEQLKFLKDSMILTGLYCDGALLTVELPESVILKITDTEPGFRGDTAKSGQKPATLETGAIVKVPLFVSSGDMIKINTRTGNYVERA